MARLVAAMIGIGLLIGFLLPTGETRPAAPAAVTGRHEVVLTRGSTGHFFTDATVNGKSEIHFMVDTGATIVALTLADARLLGIPVDPSQFAIVGEGAGGPVRGVEVTLDSVELGGIKAKNVEAVILEGSDMSLLGQSFLANVDEVSIAGDYLAMRDGA